MATIEERVEQKYPLEIYGGSTLMLRSAYINGASDQKQIDDEEYRKDMRYMNIKKQEWIDKACEWLKDHAQFTKRGEIWGFDVESFRKAMEE